jgi:ectoine hydroxylase-related dioxygenase (phytanoyl-CoA dioxygenase family)
MKRSAAVSAEARAQWTADGVVLIRGALDADAMRCAEQAFQWSLEHPGPGARPVLDGKAGAFYQDHANPAAFAAYRELLCTTGLADLIGDVMGSEAVWLLYEQIWLKEHGDTLRTPWHQDLPYVPMAGTHLATAWINLDTVPLDRSLELVRGSHRGPLYNPTAFDPDDPRAAMFDADTWPSLPDLDAERDRWPIVSWAVAPGDVVVFHPAILHGGAATRAGERRRTISLRFFGDDATCAARPESGLHDIDRLTRDDGRGDPMVAMAMQPAGSPFRHPAFPRLR